MGVSYMKKEQLEYIKVASFVIIATSLSIIAWNSSKEVSYLQGIEEKLFDVINVLNNLQQ
jgi:hypothetical protein